MNKYSIRILFCVFSFICFSNIEAYVINRTSSESLVHWASSVSVIDLYLNPVNSQGLSSITVNEQVDASIAEWNSKSRITLRKKATSGTGQNGVNEIYFSNNQDIFNGTGVVGITQVAFKDNNGEILEADIIINDQVFFTTNIDEIKYLGNVLTHEMGHFFGLGHGQVAGSTMLYALSRGQNQIAADDMAGIYSMYPTGDSTKGSLTGKIIGGNGLLGIFGAHVQAISVSSGQVAGASISDTDGSFVINGLIKNDQYYIYTNPIAQVGLPSKYNGVRYDFCESSNKYRGSFYQSCGSSDEGHPQAVKLNAATVAVGNITIRCGLDVPTEYMHSKNTTPADFDIQDNVISGLGNSFTGYFSNQELLLSQIDYFRMDYSNVDWNAVSDSEDLYIELKVINQAMYSPFKAVIGVKRNSTSYVVNPQYIQEDDGWINLESVVRIPIKRLNPSDNDIEISITPKSIVSASAGLPFVKTDYFPSSSYFEDSLSFYLVSATIVKDNGNLTYSLVSSKNDQLSDNTQCPDALNTYALSNYTIKGAAISSKAKRDESGLACGTVDLNGGPGNGPGGFFIGLIFSLMVCSLTSSIIRNNKTI